MASCGLRVRTLLLSPTPLPPYSLTPLHAHPNVLRITHQVERRQIVQRIGQAIQSTADAYRGLQPLVTSATDQDQITKLVGKFVMFIQTPHIAKRAKRDEVMDVMLA